MTCRLCLLTVGHSQRLELSENNSIAKTLISDLLPQVIIDSSSHFPVCAKCIEKLQNLKHFKHQCFSIEDKIERFKNSPRNFRKNKSGSPVNIEDVFFYFEMSKVREDVYVCRSCFKPTLSTESHSLLGDTTEAAHISSLFHDLDLNLTSNPIICQNCSTSAEDFYQFQQKCLLVQSTLEDLEDEILLSDENPVTPNEKETHEQLNVNALEEETENANYFLPENEYDIDEYLRIIATAIEKRDFNLDTLPETNLIENTDGNKEEQSQTEENHFRCSLCQYKTKRKYYLTRHIKIIHQKDCKIVYKCLYCTFNTKNKSTLDIHVKLEHDKIWETFECTKCNFAAKFQSVLTLHNIIKHDHDLDSYQCPFCKFKTSSKDDFKKHHAFKHNDGIKTYDCLYCEYRTRYRCHLKTHINAKHDTNDRNYHKCGYCGYRTKWKSSLLMHIKFKHSNDNELYECLRCDFKTKKLSRLKIHRKLAHESTDLQAYLEFRSALKNRRENKVTHEKNAHIERSIKECNFAERNDDHHKCSFCNYSSKRRDTLQRHISAKHDNDSMEYYKCTECEYQSKRKDALKRHTDVKHPKYID